MGKKEKRMIGAGIASIGRSMSSYAASQPDKVQTEDVQPGPEVTAANQPGGSLDTEASKHLKDPALNIRTKPRKVDPIDDLISYKTGTSRTDIS